MESRPSVSGRPDIGDCSTRPQVVSMVELLGRMRLRHATGYQVERLQCGTFEHDVSHVETRTTPRTERQTRHTSRARRSRTRMRATLTPLLQLASPDERLYRRGKRNRYWWYLGPRACRWIVGRRALLFRTGGEGRALARGRARLSFVARMFRPDLDRLPREWRFQVCAHWTDPVRPWRAFA